MGMTQRLASLGVSLSPKVWGVVIAAMLVVVIAVFGSGFGFGYGHGKSSENKNTQKLIKEAGEREAAQLRALNAANDRNRTLEQDHAKEVADLRAKFAGAEAGEKATDSRVIAGYLGGSDRLQLPVRSCNSAIATAVDTAAARADEQARADLTPETSAALYAIAATGDETIREHNALIDYTQSLYAKCTQYATEMTQAKAKEKR